jgi:1-acyl-sn-glycerol-3-phosphate acyltransferase
VSDDLPQTNRPVWALIWLLMVPVAALLRVPRTTGRERIPRRGGLLVVSNHVSDRDPPIIGLAFRRRTLYYMAKSELFRNRAAGWLIRAAGAFPVVRGAADRDAFRKAHGVLARGSGLLMFPEGTRSPDGRLGPPFSGAGRLALIEGVTVLPAAIWGSQDNLLRSRVVIGPPIRFDDLHGSRADRARAATDRIMAELARLLPRAGGPAQEWPPDG